MFCGNTSKYLMIIVMFEMNRTYVQCDFNLFLLYQSRFFFYKRTDRICLENNRPTGLNVYMDIRDFTLISCQKHSYLHFNSKLKSNNGMEREHYNTLIQIRTPVQWVMKFTISQTLPLSSLLYSSLSDLCPKVDKKRRNIAFPLYSHASA